MLDRVSVFVIASKQPSVMSIHLRSRRSHKASNISNTPEQSPAKAARSAQLLFDSCHGLTVIVSLAQSYDLAALEVRLCQRQWPRPDGGGCWLDWTQACSAAVRGQVFALSLLLCFCFYTKCI